MTRPGHRSAPRIARYLALLALCAAGELGGPSPAIAGSYQVSVCDHVPGQVSWTAASTDHGLWMPAYTLDPCAVHGGTLFGLGARVADNDGKVPRGAEGAMYFFAPAGTVISRISFEDIKLYAAAQTGFAALFGGDSWGGYAVGVGGVGSYWAEHDWTINVPDQRWVRLRVHCWWASCTATRKQPSAAYAVAYRPVVTVSDWTGPNVYGLVGSMWGTGWQRRSAYDVAYTAEDASGVQRVWLLVDGRRVAANAYACDYHYPQPCPDQEQRPGQPGGHGAGRGVIGSFAGVRIPDGWHTVMLEATDATGLNLGSASHSLLVDHTPPAVWVAAPANWAARHTVSVEAADATSGVANVACQLSGAGWRSGWSSYGSGARVSLPKVARAVMCRALDNSGNASPVVTKEVARMRERVVRRRHGARRLILAGVVADAGGAPVPGAIVRVAVRARAAGRRFHGWRTVIAGARGRFGVPVGRGPSREFRLSFAGSSGLLGAQGFARTTKRARSGLSVSRHMLSLGQVLVVRGRLRGGYIPRDGKQVILEARAAGARWQPAGPGSAIATARSGRWRYRHRFTLGPGTYYFRLKIPAEDDYPFATGYSRTLRVVVR
jgi:hypothetical protein